MAHLLGAEALHLEYPTRVVFDSVTIGLNEGDRIGIVGRNGDGKSTLLRLLAGLQAPDSGQVTRRGGVTVGVLAQSDDLDPVMRVGVAIVGDRTEHEWAGDARVRDVIAGLAGGIDWDAPIGTLSGGQRRRVALAALLTRDWDVLALDEPTNHLDVEGIAWLADHLRRRWLARSGGLLLVTHDRIVEPFEGGYAAYILQRVERDRQASVVEQKRQNLARKELAWLRRGAPARTSKPKFRIDAANTLIADVPPLRDPVSLRSLATARLGKDVVDLLDAGVAFDGRGVLERVTWRIAPGERTGVLGANGAGKSTLLALVAGTLEPTSGRVKRGKTVRVGVLDQGFGALAAVEDDRVREVLARTRTTFSIDGKDVTPAQLLERLGFPREHLSARVSDLSGGQRRRLQLLLVLLDGPNVLILDEPTNDLDTDMLAAIEDLLDSWAGTLLVVSHDRYFLERVTDQQYAVLAGADGAGHLRHLPGGIDEYLRLRAHARAQTPAPAPGGAVAPASALALSGAEARAMQKELQAAERRIEKLTAQVDAARTALADHDQSDYVGLGEKMRQISELEAEVAQLEDRWFELTDLLG